MRTKFPAILFFLFLFGMGVLEACLPDTDISAAERRRLAKAPALSADTLLSGSYMTDMETYLLDQFPGRNLFRCMKANFDLKLLQKEDTDGYYLIENSIYKRPAPVKENNILLCADYFDRIMRTYFPDIQGHYIVIPEKSYYAALSSKNLTLDDRDILSKQEKALSLPAASTLTGIDLYSQLSVSD